MAVFDSHIEEVLSFVRALGERGRRCKRFECATRADRPSQPRRETAPVTAGVSDRSAIILRRDTFVELGNPTAGSCACLLWTDKPSLITDGRVTLVGPDIPESSGASLPFGQVLMLAGPDLHPRDHERLQQVPIVGDQIEGYMIRSAAENIWSRVSRRAAERGFDFETLGRALLSLATASTHGISAMEVVFVTSSKADVCELGAVVSEVKSIGSEILKETWKRRGYDVDCNFDCSSCHDEEVCADIRGVLAALRKRVRAAKSDSAAGED